MAVMAVNGQIKLQRQFVNRVIYINSRASSLKIRKVVCEQARESSVRELVTLCKGREACRLAMECYAMLFHSYTELKMCS